jgi:hypothetical protein
MPVHTSSCWQLLLMQWHCAAAGADNLKGSCLQVEEVICNQWHSRNCLKLQVCLLELLQLPLATWLLTASTNAAATP